MLSIKVAVWEAILAGLEITIRVHKDNEFTSRVMWVCTKNIDIKVPTKEA